MAFYYESAIGSGDKNVIIRSLSRIMIAKVCKLLNIEWQLQFYMGSSSDENEGYLEDILEFLHVTNSDFDWDDETGYLHLNLNLPRNKMESLVEALCDGWSEYLYDEIVDEDTGESVDFKTYSETGVTLFMKYYRGRPCQFFKEYYELILRKGNEKND